MIDQLLDALGYVGSALDKPGRAVRGLLAGKPGEALAAIPFSDSLGLTDEKNRTSGRELLSGLGMDPGEGLGGDLAGMGAEVATDPLMLLGGAAGRMLGKGADAAQVARGPRYGTTAEDLAKMAKDAPEFVTPLMDGVSRGGAGAAAGESNVGSHLRFLLDSPHAGRIMSEIPEGSKIIGSGAEAMALSTPAGDVLRLGGRELSPGRGRPVHDNVLQSTRTVDIPGGGPLPYRVERVPKADHVGDAGVMGKRSRETMLTPVDEIDKGLANQGLAYNDRHMGNVGMHDGRPQVIDPGSLAIPTGFPRQEVVGAAEPGFLMRQLLGMVGGDEALRRSLAAGGNDPGLARRLGLYGAAAGADTGVAARGAR